MPSQSHFVAICETEVLLVQSVRDFLAPSLAIGGPAGVAIMVATETRRLSVDRALREAGINVPKAHRSNRLVALGSSETLASFMVNGTPDPVRFGAAVGQLLSCAA